MALTARESAFVEHYLSCRNAAEAARRAGYSAKSARQIGSENLSKPHIQEEIARFTEAAGMSKEEVLAGLVEHATASMGDFVGVDKKGQPFSKLKQAQADGKLHLIKRLDLKTTTFNVTARSRRLPAVLRDALALPVAADADDEQKADEITITETSVKIELYDRLHARELLGRHHRLFGETLDVNHGVNMNADDLGQAEEEMRLWREAQQAKKSAASASNG